MNYLLLVFRNIAVFFLVLSGYGQANEKSINFWGNISFLVYESNNNQISIADIIANNINLKSPQDFSGKTSPKNIYWVLLELEEVATEIAGYDTLYLKLNTFDAGELYYQDRDQTKEKPIGQFDNLNEVEKIKFSNYHSYITINPGNLIQNQYLILRVKRLAFKEDIKNWSFAISTESPNLNIPSKNFYNSVLYYFCAGLCFIVWFSTLSFFIRSRNSEFLYYTLYVTLIFLYITGSSFGIFGYLFDSYWVQYWFSNNLYFFANIAYLYFFSNYLRSKKDYPLIHKLVIILVWLNIIILSISVWVFISKNYIGVSYITYYGSLVLCVYATFGIIYLLFIGKNPLAYFIAIGSLFYCFSQLFRLLFSKPDDGLYLDSINYLIIGWSLELVVFTFGLNYKVHLELRENLSLQKEAFISKTKALRAQISPHFIFNSLSSIQHLIAKDNKTLTLNYLSRFGRLTRSILETSLETNVILNQEIQMLKDYLELERLRFDNAFSYTINVDPKINPSQIQMPYMILQPFVENSLIHGLLPKKDGKKQLDINFLKEPDFLVCEVIDTGVGRQQAKQRKHIYQKDKKWRGLEITQQRLEYLTGNQNNIEIVDIVNDKNEPLGTKMVIRIPLQEFIFKAPNTFRA